MRTGTAGPHRRPAVRIGAGMTNTPWTAPDYHPAITLSGAKKLADSGVAPLVAVARGYSTVLDRAGALAIAEKSAAVTAARGLGTQLARMVAGDEDILIIPWFQAARVSEQGTAVKSYTTQMRPSVPRVNEKTGKARKYEFLPGEQTTLDFHPSTPVEWISSSLQVLMTEGVLKGDSALTAQLRANGIADDELALPADLGSARQTLADLMLRVPRDARVSILSFGGVGNWRNHNDWHAIQLKDRKVLVAFDGDTATNYNVWKQANDLFGFIDSKNGQPYLLNLASLEVGTAMLAAGLDPEEKLGIDDYLTKVGSWADVLTCVQPDLPPQPERSDAEQYVVGSWRVSPIQENLVEEFAQEMQADGSKGPARWMVRNTIGGRIISSESRRRPSQREIESGMIDPDLDRELSNANCTVEIAIAQPTPDDADGLARFRVTGPAIFLAYPPSEWPRHNANIPTEVLMHPDWPPRKGAEWLAAVKANRADDISNASAWDAMGWVPVEGGHPAFIVGEHVLGRTKDDQDRTVVGVTEKTLPGVSAFGVRDTFFDLPLEEWKAQVRNDIRAVLDMYIEAGFWQNRSVAAAAVAAMFRPTIPARVNVTLYIYGPPRAGKSFTAAFIMHAWQARDGVWTVQHLPGSADDTAASLEYAIARTPIWIADDLAPSVDKRIAESQEASLSRIIRGVQSGSTRRRMDPEMKQRQIALPAALFIVTAENEPQVDSIRERIIGLETPAKTAFHPDSAVKDRMLEFTREGTAARLTAAMIRFWTIDNPALGDTWPEKIKTLHAEVASLKRTAAAVMGEKYKIDVGEATRHADQSADLAITFVVMSWLARMVGIPDDDPVMDKLAMLPDSYAYDLFDLAAGTVRQQRQTTPGRSLIHGIADLMSAGRAYVENPTLPGAPPVSVGPDDVGGVLAAQRNRALGWTYDPLRTTWVPRGISIGYFGVSSSGAEIVLFDPENAFREAQRNYPGLIPYGQTKTASWESVWAERLTSDSYKKRDRSTTTAVRLGKTGQEGFSKLLRISGVPVRLQAVLNPDYDPLDDHSEDEAD